MKYTSLLAMLAALMPLSACGSDTQTILVKDTPIRISEGVGPDCVSDHDRGGGSFGQTAFGISVATGVPHDEVIRLQGWETVVDEPKPEPPDGTIYCYWIHPTLLEKRDEMREKRRNR